jgi:hypothetical protein
LNPRQRPKAPGSISEIIEHAGFGVKLQGGHHLGWRKILKSGDFHPSNSEEF